MPPIPVTYLCWGCGSDKTVIENVDENLPALEIWNVCPECIKKRENNG